MACRYPRYTILEAFSIIAVSTGINYTWYYNATRRIERKIDTLYKHSSPIANYLEDYDDNNGGAPVFR